MTETQTQPEFEEPDKKYTAMEMSGERVVEVVQQEFFGRPKGIALYFWQKDIGIFLKKNKLFKKPSRINLGCLTLGEGECDLYNVGTHIGFYEVDDIESVKITLPDVAKPVKFDKFKYDFKLTEELRLEGQVMRVSYNEEDRTKLLHFLLDLE